MRRALVIGTIAGAVFASQVDVAAATIECRGLSPCIPIAGPWVVVPVGRTVPRPQVSYQLTCPRGYVVGGLDAELTDRAIDVAFLGKTGSPVSPGVATSRAVVFVATYVGAATRVQSFRPHIGCIPAQGGGRRTPTAVSAVVPPGEATVRRVKTIRVPAGATRRIVQGCRPDERLVAASHARAFFTRTPPSAQLISSFSASRAVRSGNVRVVARGGFALQGVRAVVQVTAVCAGGR